MGVEDRYPHVVRPIRIGGCELRNRIVRSAHGTGFGQDGITERLIAYHEARARGGVGLMIVETASVHPSSGTGAGLLATGAGRSSDLPAYQDAMIPGWARLAERVHAHGAKVFQQLWHGGSIASPLDGTASWAPSTVPEPHAGRLPQAMTQAMIDEIVAAFAAAARRCRDAGLDGVEVHGAHGYLVGQFLSPLTNRRTDAYGGDPRRRLRFAREVLAAMREAVGPGYPVGIRLSSTEGIEGGIQPDEAAVAARELERAGLADFIDVSMGSHNANQWMVAGMHVPHGYELPHAQVVTSGLTVPTIVTGRILTLGEAEDVLAKGIGDLVSMVRATIADADLVAKSLAGQEATVRPCLGINQGCGERGRIGLVSCTVNVHVGAEHLGTDLGTAPVAKRVMVVGAGPAGMEAALVAAARGHRVTVYERSDATGGLTRLSRRAPYRDEIGRICDFQASELRRLGVDVVCGSTVDVALVRSEAPDAVIVATGSLPRRDAMQRVLPALGTRGADLPHVVTPLEVLGDAPPAARRALVLDGLGTYPAIAAAEQLLERGTDVVLATGDLAVGLGTGSDRPWVMPRLLRRPGFQTRVRVVVEEITPETVCLRSLDTDGTETLEADLVVLMTAFESQTDLHQQLVAAGVDCRLAGDALLPRYLQHAIATGHRAGLAV